MPPIKCIPCRLTYNGKKYRVYADGSVGHGLTLPEAQALSLNTLAEILAYESEHLKAYGPETSEARTIRREASRRRRNRNARERHAAMRDLGMKRTPMGWE